MILNFMKKEFNQIEYQNRWIKENYTAVKVSFKKEFVLEFKKACRKLGKSQSSVIKEAMEKAIKEAEGK